MKKVFSFILIALTLLSCVVFSACGNKYKNLKIRIMSKEGETIERVDFSIMNGEVDKQTIKVSFSGIDKDDVGQIKVSSYPTKLIEDSNYRYEGKSCFVDILPLRSTKNQDAKLIVKHLASGKEANIELNIDEKANGIQVFDTTYIVSIPEEIKDENDQDVINKHKLDFSQVSMLSPETSTDQVYFKLDKSIEPTGVKFTKIDEEISSKIEWAEPQEAFDLYTGFEVSGAAENNSTISIYPVTIYRNQINVIGEDPIRIRFKKVLTPENVELAVVQENVEGVESLDVNKLEVVANDNQFQSLILQLRYITKDDNDEIVKTPLVETDFLDMYKIVPQMGVDCPLNIVEDADKNIYVQLAIKTDDYQSAEIQLVPKNYVGDYQTVTKTIAVKGVLKANGIELYKNGKLVENHVVENERFDIFNYYSEGNSLGTELSFVPYANSRENVYEKLNKMQIVIKPEILYHDKNKGYNFYEDEKFTKPSEYMYVENSIGVTRSVGSQKYVIVVHKFNSPMKFYYNPAEDVMISEPFTEIDKIFVKYADGKEKVEGDLSFIVRTINNATEQLKVPTSAGVENSQIIYKYPHWAKLEPTGIKLNFNRQEGVVSMKLAVGTATSVDSGTQYETDKGFTDKIYLERTQIPEKGYYFIQPKTNSVMGIVGELASATFDVEVTPLFDNCENPLTIVPNNKADVSIVPAKKIKFTYNSDSNEVIKFVYDSTTSIGKYEIVFKQDENIKAKAVVMVYEVLSKEDFSIENNIQLEDSAYAIKNYEINPDSPDGYSYKYQEYEMHYIVAVGEKLKLSVVNLPKNVLDSGIISSYKFEVVKDPENDTLNDQSQYIQPNQELGSNCATLNFLKGTKAYNAEERKYFNSCVSIKVTVQQQLISLTGVATQPNESVSYVLDFFIYERITKDAISLSETSLTKYYNESLGVLYKDFADTNININISNTLSRYVTNIEWEQTRITNNNKNITELKDEGFSISPEFNQEPGILSEQNIFIVKLTQFNETFELRCVVDVKSAVLTEKLLITSPVKFDGNQNCYINLKEGEEYQVTAENISSFGAVTFPDTIIQVVDGTGNAMVAQDYFEVKQDVCKIKVTKIPENDSDFKLIVFAKDVLKQFPSVDMSGYHNPSNFIMESLGADKNIYKNAYFVLDIELSNGTKDHPYLITSSEEFWQIDDQEEYKDKYWRLQNNINLASDPSGVNQIKGFAGYLSTLPIQENNVAVVGNEPETITYNQFTIGNVKITNKSLFTNNKGTINNITFEVEFKNAQLSGSVGLFDVNDGTLTDVGVVDVSGEITLTSTTLTRFGVLVGENTGAIEYTSTEGVVGSITIAKSQSNAYIGGLVGYNTGTIVGCAPEGVNQTSGNQYVIESSDVRKNALAEISITSAELGNDSAIGGLVGYNAGIIRNGFVNAQISAPTVSNVGGVIGINQQQDCKIGVNVDENSIIQSLTLKNSVISDIIKASKNNAIYNVKSTANIVAKNNVGGITGADTSGLYLDCDFQILQTESEKLALLGLVNVGGIAGKSTGGKFLYCSTMSYKWSYANLKSKPNMVIDGDLREDILGNEYVGGIVGQAYSTSDGATYNGVIIAYSSVNAYLKAGEYGNIGGIVNNSNAITTATIIFNAYFIGRLEGNVVYVNRVQTGDETGVCLSNDESKNILFNNVYSINIEINNVKVGSYKGGQSFIYDIQPNDIPYWGLLEGINGNYIFVSIDENGDVPIFDRAPETLDVSVHNKYQKRDTNNAPITDTLFLNYYDFSIDTDLTESQLLAIDKLYNRDYKIYKMLDGNNVGLFDITAHPNNLGNVVIKVSSSDSNVVRVSGDSLHVMGVGECWLTFSSVLNQGADDVIKVVVDYPIGDSFDIKTLDGVVTKNYVKSSIAVGFSEEYYVKTDGTKGYQGQNYSYRTQSNPNLEITIISSSSYIKDYLEVSGFLIGEKEVTLKLNSFTPFVISVLEKLAADDDYFTITVKPYKTTKVGETDDEYVVYYQYEDENSTQVSVDFKLYTAVGPTNVAFSFDEAIIYPNDLVQIFAHISTDKQLNHSEIFKMLNGDQVFIMNTNNYDFEPCYSSDSVKKFKILRTQDDKTYNYGTVTIAIVTDDEMNIPQGDVQTVEFSIQYERASNNETAQVLPAENIAELTNELSFTLKIATNYGYNATLKNEATADFTLIPQKISNFDVKNYYYKNKNETETELVKENILKSNKAGVIQIDLVPDNGYYSYLEISDKTGDQEILFTQVDKIENGKMVNEIEIPSSDKTGIKLTKTSKTLYVRTQIDKSYNSKMHTIELRAYSAEDKLLYSQYHYLDVKMLPNITMEYLNPNGSTAKKAIASGVNAEEIAEQNAWLANGVDAEFRIKIENSNTDLEHTLSGDLKDKYEFIHDVNDYYVLKRKSLEEYAIDSADIDKDVKIHLSTRYEHENGDVDIAECSFEFKIVPFVIHGISVNNSTVNMQGENEIYGYVGKNVKLEFYFGKNDISFYDVTQPTPFWNTEYRSNIVIDEDNTALEEHYDQLEQIKTILDTLNKKEDNPVSGNNSYSNYIKLLITDENESGKIKFIEKSESLFNELQIDSEIKNSKLEIGFEVTCDDDNNWSIHALTPNIDTDSKYQIQKTYKLNFFKTTSWYDPEIIFNEQDFFEMEAGKSYILATDLTFGDNVKGIKDYNGFVPVDLDLLEFDGNGRKITIKKFAPFKNEEIQAGLFAKVYENMIVKNVVVEYAGEFNSMSNYYYDLCNGDANYSLANFGGIAAVNNGIITNCHVEGSVRLRASVIEQRKTENSSSYQTNMFIGGVVVENSKTGYITNSTSRLNINSQANIGGFVHTNKGKIASSGVIDTEIYTYNNQLENTFVINVAGFAVENTGEISMSYVKLRTVTNPEATKTFTKTISAKDISAGFAYSNNGKIYDAYVEMEKIGFNNNAFAGFVYSNAGTIERAYTYINKGELKNASDSLFAPRETEGLKDCIEFVLTKYTNNIESGLEQVMSTQIYNKNVYVESSFAFGDNVSAVWTIQSGSMPTLVAEQEISKADESSIDDEGIGGLLSFIKGEPKLDETTGKEEIVYKVSNANYGTKNNPYIIHTAVDIKDESGNVIVQNTWQLFTGEILNLSTGETELVRNPYFRIVKDIDFTEIGNNPKTFDRSFNGNIQGNNMILKNIMLYSVEKQESIGLFKEMVGIESLEVENAVRNLTLTTSSVWASKTQAVGLLAGVIEDFNLYNIRINSENVIMVGGNAVGGIAGIIRGNFDLDSLSSNIGINSNRATGLSSYSIYMGKNNKANVSENLSDVYYAGSVAGILDGFDRSVYSINSQRNTTKNFFKVKNVNVTGNVILLGDSVGAAFGFIGERTHVSRVNINISGELSGYQYSGVLAGENRGVIDNRIKNDENAQIVFADDMFANSANVSAGVVGLNIGGLVMNVDVVGNIKLNGSKMAGGIVGKNINGVVANTYYEGEIFAYIVGGAVAGDYTVSMFNGKTNGSGAISFQNKSNVNLIPKQTIKYENPNEITDYQNISFGAKTIKFWIDNIKKFYVYSKSDQSDDIQLEAVKLLGLIVGLTGYSEDAEQVKRLSIESSGFKVSEDVEEVEGVITFNAENGELQSLVASFKADLLGTNSETASTQADSESSSGERTTGSETTDPGAGEPNQGEEAEPPVAQPLMKTYENQYQLKLLVGDFELYLVGALSHVADLWNRSYSQNFVVLTK